MTVLAGLRELLSPGSVRRASLPPFEAGLSPDSALDSTEPLLAEDCDVDDVVILPSGSIVCSVGRRLGVVADRRFDATAEFDDEITALTARGESVIVAVAGTGLFEVVGGSAAVIAGGELASGVSDLAVAADGTVYATVASRRLPVSEWSRGLLGGDTTGELWAVEPGGRSRCLADGLRWPSGVCITLDDRLLIAESLGAALRVFDRDGGAPTSLASNLPFYPGRVRSSALGYWIVGPYVRNRATELILSEPTLMADMAASINPAEWMVPRLRSDGPHTDALQLGQLRVLGVLKPWAPARSYGLVAHLDHAGRFDWSAHSRTDGVNHGITGVAEGPRQLVLAARGRRNLLAVNKGTSA